MLLQKHQNEILKSVPQTELGRRIVELNFFSIEDPRVFDSIFYWNHDRRRVHSDSFGRGWAVMGVDPKTGERTGNGAQFKSDTPRSNKDGKLIKYESVKGDQTYPLFLDTGDSEFWANHRERAGAQVWLVEGAKKAACLLALGIPAISLPGVWNGMKKGWVVTKLKRWLKPGMNLYLAFDADWRTKEGVRKAMVRFGAKLRGEGCNVLVPVWGEGKGIDDYLMAFGSDEARLNAIAGVTAEGTLYSFEQWLDAIKGLDAEGNEGGKLNAEQTACKIAEDLGDTLKLNLEIGRWMAYAHKYDGLWSVLDPVEFRKILIDKIKELRGKVTKNFVNEVTYFLEPLLFQADWSEHETINLLPFRNGVLDLGTGELTEHDPDNMLTWQIPRYHNPEAQDWSQIHNWMEQATRGDRLAIKTLLAFINATLKGRYELQKYLHLTGDGGTGKGTFISLMRALIGDETCQNTTLKRTCENQFEIANFYGKRLIIFPDQLPYSGSIEPFLGLTGGDAVTGEIKGGKVFNFKHKGMVLMASNKPVFPGQSASAINRRVRMLPFEVKIADEDRDPNLIDKLTHEEGLSALINFCLRIPDLEVQRILFGLQSSNEMNCRSWEYRMREDSIAAWLNDKIICDENASSPIGSDKQDETSLFGSYWKYCEANGLKAKSSVKFSPEIEEVCSRILGWKVSKVRKDSRYIFQGIRLRETYDTALTHFEFLGSQLQGNFQEVADSVWAEVWTPEPAPVPFEPQPYPEPEKVEVETQAQPGVLTSPRSTTSPTPTLSTSTHPPHPLPQGSKVTLRAPNADGVEGTILRAYPNPAIPDRWCYSVQNCSAIYEVLAEEVELRRLNTGQS